MAELVDAPASGAGVRMDVEVRVLFWAPSPGVSRPYLQIESRRRLPGARDVVRQRQHDQRRQPDAPYRQGARAEAARPQGAGRSDGEQREMPVGRIQKNAAPILIIHASGDHAGECEQASAVAKKYQE